MTKECLREYGGVQSYNILQNRIWDVKDALDYILSEHSGTGLVTIMNKSLKEGVSQVIYSGGKIIDGSIPSFLADDVVSHVNVIENSDKRKFWTILLF